MIPKHLQSPSRNDQFKPYPTSHIFGIQLSKMSMVETIAYLTQAIASSQTIQVITANPIMIMSALEDPDLMEIMQQAELIVPDGAGLVWASKYLQDPVSERVAGFDLLHELLQVGNLKEWKVYLLGATKEIAENAARQLQMKYSSIRIVGVQHGYFDEHEDHRIIQDIRNAQPHLLFVARSADKQEKWIAANKELLNVPVMIGVGGSFDVIAGKLKRAPFIWRQLRLEWLFRLLQEPRRYKRMFALPNFIIRTYTEKKNPYQHYNHH